MGLPGVWVGTVCVFVFVSVRVCVCVCVSVLYVHLQRPVWSDRGGTCDSSGSGNSRHYLFPRGRSLSRSLFDRDTYCLLLHLFTTLSKESDFVRGQDVGR